MSETPMIAFHGGKCCGIKIIHSLGENPDATAEEIVKVKRTIQQAAPDRFGQDISSSVNMYNENCPSETYLERVDRYIKYLRAVRPEGIIEIVLAQDPDEDDPDILQVTIWGPLLLERGFVEVNSCHNSNSGNRIHVYHLTLDK